MFEVEPMSKIRVLCTKRDLDAVVEALYKFGSIHVTRSTAFQTGIPSARLEAVSHKLVKLRAVESTLALKSYSGAKHIHTMDDAAVEREFEALKLGEFDSLAKRKQEIESKLNELRTREKELRPFKSVKLNPAALSPRLDLAAFDVLNEAKALEKAKEFGDAALLKGDGKGRTKLIAAWDKTKGEKARHALAPFAKETALPQSAKAFNADYAETAEAVAGAEHDLSHVKHLLNEFSSRQGAKIARLREELEVLFKKADLPAKFGQSELSASAEGWVPQKSMRELEGALAGGLGEKVFLEHLHTREMPPSKLANLFAVRPFEFMIEFFSLPRYKEIDPTFITAFTFPLFFGMILGDLGYGLVLLLLGLFLALKFKAGFLKSIGGMLVLSAISTMIFGVIYAEFFGAESIFGIMPLHPLLSRVEESGINVLFALSVLIGFLHLTLGLLLGAWQGLREKHANHALAKFSWILILFGFTALIANSTKLIFTEYLQFVRVLAPPFDIGALLLGIAGLVYFEGAVQLLEIPSLISNVLSYLRIMALGLSGVALAGIIASIPLNLSSLSTPGGIVSFILFAILVVVGHAVAIALGLIEAGIQSLRLHYVEFYSKFYKGGGTRFIPLRED